MVQGEEQHLLLSYHPLWMLPEVVPHGGMNLLAKRSSGFLVHCANRERKSTRGVFSGSEDSAYHPLWDATRGREVWNLLTKGPSRPLVHPVLAVGGKRSGVVSLAVRMTFTLSSLGECNLLGCFSCRCLQGFCTGGPLQLGLSLAPAERGCGWHWLARV